MVGYIRDLAVGKRGWVTEETFREGVALCQSLPGATAMQTAAYAGLRAGGGWGAVAAYAGFGLPAFVLMVGLSAMYHEARALGPALAVFRGLQAIVVAIVLAALGKPGCRFDWSWMIPDERWMRRLGYDRAPLEPAIELLEAGVGRLGVLRRGERSSYV